VRQRAATSAWRFALATLQPKNFCSGHLSLCDVDCRTEKGTVNARLANKEQLARVALKVDGEPERKTQANSLYNIKDG